MASSVVAGQRPPGIFENVLVDHDVLPAGAIPPVARCDR
jgi:hypothetical protein